MITFESDPNSVLTEVDFVPRTPAERIAVELVDPNSLAGQTFDKFIRTCVSLEDGSVPPLSLEYADGSKQDFSRVALGGGSYSEGEITLVHARLADKLDRGRPERNYCVVTGNIDNGDIQKWHISRVGASPRSLDDRGEIALFLDVEPPREQQPETDQDSALGVIRGFMARQQRIREARQKRDAPRLILSPKKNCISYNGNIEPLHSIIELQQATSQLRSATAAAIE